MTCLAAGYPTDSFKASLREYCVLSFLISSDSFRIILDTFFSEHYIAIYILTTSTRLDTLSIQTFLFWLYRIMQTSNASSIDEILSILTPEQRLTMEKALNLTTKNLAIFNRRPKNEEEKTMLEFYKTIHAIVYNVCVAPTTARPEGVRQHFVDYFKNSILDDHFDLDVDQDTLVSVIDDAMNKADIKRPRHTEQAKLIILKAKASEVLHNHTRLSDYHRGQILDVLEDLPKIPNSTFPNNGKKQTAAEVNTEKDSEWDNAIQKGKEAAEKDIENRKKSTERQREKKRARTEAENTATVADADEDNVPTDGEGSSEAMDHSE